MAKKRAKPNNKNVSMASTAEDNSALEDDQSRQPKDAIGTIDHPRASFMRRLAAMIYDTLVAVAVGMVAGLVILVTMTILHANGVIGNQFEHFSDFAQQSMVAKLTIQLWVLCWVAGFFMWFWAKGGQTIGMRAWRLRIFSTVDEPMTLMRLFIRLFTSLLGLGTLLVLFDVKHKLALQDRCSQTEMLTLTKEANDHKNWR